MSAHPVPDGRPPDPKEGRQDVLVRALQVALVLLLAVALAALLLPGGAAAIAGRTMVGLLVAVPLLRVTWMLVRWARKRDIRHALLAGGLLVVVASGVVVAS